jgi:dTMP kinase
MVLEHRTTVSPATLAALFAADRADHLFCAETGILARLRRSIDIVSDRYYLSSFAYQGLSVDWAWIAAMHEHCIRPDVTFFVDVPVDVCLKRIARRRGTHFDLFENQDTLIRAQRSHLAAIGRLRQAGDRIEVVDGNAPPSVVHERIWQVMQSVPSTLWPD